MAWNRGNNFLFYNKETSPGNWISTQQIQSGCTNPTGIAMTLDASNNPHVVYESATNGWPRYSYYNGSFWSQQWIESSYATGSAIGVGMGFDQLIRVAFLRSSDSSVVFASYLGGGSFAFDSTDTGLDLRIPFHDPGWNGQ